MYLNDLEARNLIELTESFVEFLDSLHREGSISELQFSEMTEKKVEFIKKMKNKEKFMNA